MNRIAKIFLLAKQAGLPFNNNASLFIPPNTQAEDTLINFKLCDKKGNLTPGGKVYEPINNFGLFNDKMFQMVLKKVLDETVVRMEAGLELNEGVLDALDTVTFYYNLKHQPEPDVQIPQEVIEDMKEDQEYLAQVLTIPQEQVESFGLEVTPQEEVKVKKTRKKKV